VGEKTWKVLPTASHTLNMLYSTSPGVVVEGTTDDTTGSTATGATASGTAESGTAGAGAGAGAVAAVVMKVSEARWVALAVVATSSVVDVLGADSRGGVVLVRSAGGRRAPPRVACSRRALPWDMLSLVRRPESWDRRWE
jgi:hypothetical protein